MSMPGCHADMASEKPLPGTDISGRGGHCTSPRASAPNDASSSRSSSCGSSAAATCASLRLRTFCGPFVISNAAFIPGRGILLRQTVTSFHGPEHGAAAVTIPFSHVDAFSSRPFGGNPAVVCRVAEWPSTAWMQDVSAEMNAGATVFIRRVGAEIQLRWFSPTVELDLCGHGTLAAAHVLWQAGDADATQPITFQTRAGSLMAVREADRIVLDFPALA